MPIPILAVKPRNKIRGYQPWRPLGMRDRPTLICLHIYFVINTFPEYMPWSLNKCKK